MTRRSLAAALLPAVLLFAGCAAAEGAATPAQPVPEEPVWSEPQDYSFAVTSSCGEQTFIGDYRVTVAGGAVVAADWRNPGDGRWGAVDPAQLDGVPSLGDMLDRARAAADDPAAGEVAIESDAGDGHPTEIRIDPIETAIDDESCYVVTDYLPSA